MAGTFGGSIKLAGESEYRQALKNITQSLREVSSELKLTSSQYDSNDKSVTNLKNKQQALNEVLKAQAKVVESAKSAYDKFKAKVEEQAKAHNELEKKYKDAQEELERIKETSGETSKEYQEQKTKVEQLASAVGKSATANNENENALSKLKVKLNDAQSAYNATEREVNGLNNEMKNAQAEETRSQSSMGKLNATIEEQEKKLSELKEAYKNASLNGTKEETKALGNEIKTLSGELAKNKEKMSELDKSADDLDESLKNAGDSAQKSSGGFTVMKGALANLASSAISTCVDKLKDMATQTIETGKNFDSSMSNVGAISGATGGDLEKLRDKAKEMGEKTKFSASEAADGMSYMAMAGWKTNDMLGGISGVMDLAAASGSDLATTSDIVTDALTAFGKSASDSGRLADIMASASSNANTNVELMGETFKYCASTAGSLGYSMEDTSIAIGLMANSGVKGSQAGTSLKNILVNLSKPTKQMKVAMDKLGISLTDSKGKMKPLSQVMGELREKFGKLNEKQKAQYASTLAGKEGMAGLLAIVNASPKDFDKLTNAVNNSSGSAEKMAKTMNDNLGGDLTLLGSHLESVQIALYEKFEPALREGVKALNGLLDAVQFVSDHSSEFVLAIQAMATGLGAYVAYTTAIKIMKDGFTSLTVVTKLQAAAQAALNAVMSLSTVGIVVAGIAALIVVFVALWNKSEAFRNFWIGVWNAIKSTVSSVVSSISSFLSSAWGAISSTISTVWNGIKSTITTVVNAISSVITTVFNGIKNVITTVWNGIKTVTSTVWGAIVGFVTSYINNVKTVITTVFNAIKNVVTTVWNGIKSVTSTVWNAIKMAVSTPVNAIKSVVTSVWNGIKSTTTSVWNGIKNAISKPLDTAKNLVKNVINSIKGFFNFKISWPHIPLPHFSIKPSGWHVGDLLKGKIPTLGITWHAQGGVFDKGATVLRGVGENGAEAVVPLEKNTYWIKRVADEMRGYIIDAISMPKISVDMPSKSENISDTSYNRLVEAFKEALSQMKIEMDDEEMGKFVDKTVSKAIFQ